MKKRLLPAMVWWMAMQTCLLADGGLTQWSTIDALLKGYYDGVAGLGEMKKSGDFGLGTLESLDGEMLMLDGRVYQIDSRGVVHEPADTVRTPFAAATFFKGDIVIAAPAGLTLEALQTRIDAVLPSSNLFYAIRVTGRFAHIKTRSVAKQEKPYRPLGEVVKTQSLFTFDDSAGTMAGFRCPGFAKGLNVPGYHLHYLTSDRRGGGHVLGLVTGAGVRVEVSVLRDFTVKLPDSAGFNALDLSGDRSGELEAAESLRK
ncbi:MAG: acetolactate decarboxylase [Opitutaceae bacterium]